MLRNLTGLFLIAHGLVTVAVWGTGSPSNPQGGIRPPNPAHSWVLGDARAFSLGFGVLVGVALIVAAIGFLTNQSWWPTAAIGASIASLMLFGIFFTPWWAAGIAISIALLVAALRATQALPA